MTGRTLYRLQGPGYGSESSCRLFYTPGRDVFDNQMVCLGRVNLWDSSIRGAGRARPTGSWLA